MQAEDNLAVEARSKHRDTLFRRNNGEGFCCARDGLA
jgi:hypothetical protein